MAASLGPAAARFAAGEARLTRVGADTGAWPPAALVVPLQRWLSTAPAGAVAALPNMALVAALHARRGPAGGPECDAAADAALNALLAGGDAAPLPAAAPALRRALVHLRAAEAADAAPPGEGVCRDALRRLLLAASAAGARHAPLLREAAALLAAHVVTCGSAGAGAPRSEEAVSMLCALLSPPGAAFALRGSPEALQKLALTAWCERRAAEPQVGLPPLLARFTSALAAAGRCLRPADVARALAPLDALAAAAPDAHGITLLAALRAALAPMTLSSDDESCPSPAAGDDWRPAFEVLAPPADGYQLRSLYAPAGGATQPPGASPTKLDTAAVVAQAARALEKRVRPVQETASLRLALAMDGCGVGVPGATQAAIAAAGACLYRLLNIAAAASEYSEPSGDDDDDVWAIQAAALAHAVARFGSCMPEPPLSLSLANHSQEGDDLAELDSQQGDDSDAAAPRAAAMLRFAEASSPAAAALTWLAGDAADAAVAAPAQPAAAAARARRRASLLRALLCARLGTCPPPRRMLTSALVEAAALLPADEADAEAWSLTAANCAAACAAAPRHWPALVAQAARPAAAVAALRGLAERIAVRRSEDSGGMNTATAAAHAEAALAGLARSSTAAALPPPRLDAADELLASFVAARPDDAWSCYFGAGAEGARLLTWLLLAQAPRLGADAALLRADVAARAGRAAAMVQMAHRVQSATWRHAARAAATALRRTAAMAAADAAWAADALRREDLAAKAKAKAKGGDTDHNGTSPRPAKRARTLTAWDVNAASDAVLDAQTAPLAELLGAAAGDAGASAAAMARALVRGTSAAARAAALHAAARAVAAGPPSGASRLMTALDEAFATLRPARPPAEARAARELCARAAAECDDCALLA